MLFMLFIIWNGWKYMFHTLYLRRTHVLACIVHSSSFVWKFRRDLMVRPYRYNEHHMLPEKGYDVASYP
jgi:hypothetical protein